jgi:hypothetical protein
LISTHAPTEGKEVEEKFYSSLDRACDAFPNYGMKTTLRDFKSNAGKRVLFVSSMLRAHPSQRNM